MVVKDMGTFWETWNARERLNEGPWYCVGSGGVWTFRYPSSRKGWDTSRQLERLHVVLSQTASHSPAVPLLLALCWENYLLSLQLVSL